MSVDMDELLDNLVMQIERNSKNTEGLVGLFPSNAIELVRCFRFELRKEICICSAIQMPDGELIRGHRHDSCYDVVRRRPDAEEKRLDIVHAAQGFITSRNRFVDRREAMTLQRASGLPSRYRKDGAYVGEELFSEDLY